MILASNVRDLVSHQVYRAGVIPYVIHEGSVMILLVLDCRYGQLTDAGGKVKDGENWIDAALREGDEETRNIFSFRDRQEEILDTGTVLFNYYKNMASILVPVSGDPYTLSINYCLSFREGLRRGDPIESMENWMLIPVSVNDLYRLCKIKDYSPHRTKYRETSVILPPQLRSVFRKFYRRREIRCYPTIYHPIASLFRVGLPFLNKLENVGETNRGLFNRCIWLQQRNTWSYYN